jgi:cathepsin H
LLKILFVLGLATLCLSNVHLNVKYRQFLNGAGEFDQTIAKEIYSQFKSVHSERSEYRFKVFVDTLKEIRVHNAGKHTWTQGINEYSDMTFEEFSSDKLMTPQNCSATNSFKKIPSKSAIPATYDWTTTGMVSPVKSQGSCGSCWTFSTVGALESHWNILGKGRNTTFAEQQLVDCAGAFENHGCEGGLPSHAFEYIRYAGGIESSLTYPYTAKDGQCAFRKNIAVGYVRFGSYNITQGDEVELAQKLYE